VGRDCAGTTPAAARTVSITRALGAAHSEGHDTDLTHKHEKKRERLITLRTSNRPLDQHKRTQWQSSTNDDNPQGQYYDI
jgi:hypothetical protein